MYLELRNLSFESRKLLGNRNVRNFYVAASYWGFASGHRLFPASYWGFAICEAFQFWQAIGDLQVSALLKRFMSGRLWRIRNLCKSNSFHFPAIYWGFAMYETSMLRQAIGDLQVGIVLFPASYWGFAICETFQFWQAMGDLQEERPPKALQSVLDRFTFQQAIGDSQSMKLLTCGQAIGDLQVECFLKV